MANPRQARKRVFRHLLHDAYSAAVVTAQTDSKNQSETQEDSRTGQPNSSRELG